MLSHTAIVGNPQEGIYSQTLVTSNFFIVLCLEGSGVNLELGRNTLAKIEEIISQTPTITPSEIVEIQKEEFANGIKLNILVAWIEDQKLHLSCVGDVAAKLIRQGKMVNLTAASVSGTLLPGDLLTLATNQYFIDPSPENPRVSALEIKLELQFTPSRAEEQPIFLRQPPDFRLVRRKIFYLSLIILISLISLIVFQLRSKVLEQRAALIQSLAAGVQDSQNSAQKLAGLNDTIARDLLLSARKNFITKAETAFGKDWQKDKKLAKILTDLDSQIASVSRVYPLSKLDVFYDFSLLKAGAKISSVWSHKEKAIALDSDNGAIYSLNLETKGAAVVTGSDALKKGKFVDFSGEDYFVFSSDGVFLPKTVIKTSDKWGSIKDLKIYAGNTYLLDSVNNQIWKNQEIPYLRAGSVDFSNVIAMAIDGSIYVLTSTGNIAKFTSGLPENFKITGLPEGLKDPRSFFTSDETENIYVLDSGGKRVVILSKKGAYLAQYLLPSSFEKIVTSDTLKKIFLFSAAKVYAFSL